MHVTRIIPESFKVEGALAFKDCAVEVWLGDIEKDGVLRQKAAMRVCVLFKSNDNEFQQVFKGYDMLKNACEWLLIHTEGEFNYNNIGPKWLSELYDNACL
jgi:hypothetical protein